MKVIQDPCRLCGSEIYHKIAYETRLGIQFTIVQCKNCSLVYTQDSIAEVSPDYVGLTEQDLNAEHIWRQGKHKEPAFRQCLQLIDSVANKAQMRESLPTILDVGCGVGQWLQFVKPRYQCYGFDASTVQASYAQGNIPNVQCAVSLDEYRNKTNGALPVFDLITLWDVLEHIRHPIEFTVELINSLSDQGLFFASIPAATPMVIKQKLLAIGWPRSRFSWSPEEHVVYYSPKTIRRLMKQIGLSVISIGSVVAYPRPLSVFEVIRRSGFLVTRVMPQLSPQIYVLATKSKRAMEA